MGMPGTALGGSLVPGTAVGEKTGEVGSTQQVSESPSQESPTFQRHLDVIQPFLGAERD